MRFAFAAQCGSPGSAPIPGSPARRPPSAPAGDVVLEPAASRARSEASATPPIPWIDVRRKCRRVGSFTGHRLVEIENRKTSGDERRVGGGARVGHRAVRRMRETRTLRREKRTL